MPPTQESKSGPMMTFMPSDLEKQLQFDSFLRYLIFFGLPIGCVVLVGIFELSPDLLGLGIMMMAGAWMVLNVISARAWQQVAVMPDLFAMDPQQVEARIAMVLKSKPLVKQVRLLTYHRLATLRHQQQDFAQTIMICQSILFHELKNAEPITQHVLLMLTESHIASGDAQGAYMSLLDLSDRPLSLTHRLQKLALQTRYELLVGYHQNAITDIHAKIQMAELMPPLQCGAMHVLFQVAASNCDKTSLTQWLEERARLLLSDEQYEQVYQSMGMPTVTSSDLMV